MGTQSWHAGRKGSSWQEKSSKSTMKMTRFGTFLIIAALSSFITAAPQKRAAMDYEAICNSAAAAYSNAKAEHKRDGGVLQRRRQGRHRGAHPCVQDRHPRLPQGQDRWQEVQQGEDRGVRRVSQGF